MNDIQKRNKELIEKYPYLQPRNVWTDKICDDYDYSYINGIGELPRGWEKLFLQMCEDIKQPLIDADYLDKFRFTQIKEKYNHACFYNHGAPDEVWDIIGNYEYVSQFVCQNCGKPSKYETQGWIAGYCEDCIKNTADADDCEIIEFNPIRQVTIYNKEGKHTEEYDVSDIWNRLYNKEVST